MCAHSFFCIEPVFLTPSGFDSAAPFALVVEGLKNLFPFFPKNNELRFDFIKHFRTVLRPIDLRTCMDQSLRCLSQESCNRQEYHHCVGVLSLGLD